MSDLCKMDITLEKHRLSILASTGAVGMYYWLILITQARTKLQLHKEYKKRGEVFDRYYTRDPRMLSIDRIAANTQEQLVPFLTSLWLHSLFVDSDVAGKLGLTWLAIRVAYTYLVPKKLTGKPLPKRVLLATLPCYCIIVYLFGGAAIKAYRHTSNAN